jgi:hypothetical protein
MFKYEITVMESERGWGQDYWTEQFDTPEQAQARIVEINSKNTSPVAPDYYVQAYTTIKTVEIDDYQPKHRKAMT